MTRPRKAKVRGRAPSSSAAHKIEYDGFRGPDPTWLSPVIKEHLDSLRRHVTLDPAASRLYSLDDAERLYRRHFNKEGGPLDEIYAGRSMPPVIELAILCRQIAGKGRRRSELFRDYLLLKIELDRDKSLEQAEFAKKPRTKSLANRIRTLNIESYADAKSKHPELVNELAMNFGPEEAKRKLSQAISKAKAKEKEKSKLP